jgi:hypothetical protein
MKIARRDDALVQFTFLDVESDFHVDFLMRIEGSKLWASKKPEPEPSINRYSILTTSHY